MLAPPLPTASISPSLHANRLNLSGSSLRSKNMPWGASIGPKLWPVAPPMPPYAWLSTRCVGLLPESGPCCWALARYCANESGKEDSGEAG